METNNLLVPLIIYLAGSLIKYQFQKKESQNKEAETVERVYSNIIHTLTEQSVYDEKMINKLKTEKDEIKKGVCTNIECTTRQNKLIAVFFLVVCFSFVSCSPQARLHRLLKKYPELIQRDTLKIRDTIRTAPKEANFSVPFKSVSDCTKIITKDKISIQYKIIRDTLRFNVKVRPDTIIVNKNVPVEKVVYKTTTTKNTSALTTIYIISFIIVVLALFLFLLFRFGFR